MRRAILAREVLLTALSLLWLVAGAEALDRFTGGWRFDRLALVARERSAAASVDSATAAARQQMLERPLLAAATYGDSVDADWFFLPAVEVHEPSSPQLAARTKANSPASGEENFVWNDALFGPHPDPHLLDLLPTLNEREIFAFHSYDGTIWPHYRLYPGNDFSPTPWITNRYGWLGADVPLRKPHRTVRVGIIGDSTSQNFYGLQLQAYLNAWAASAHLDVSFEVLNGARQGLEWQDELAVLKYELLPLGLDYAYAYFAPIFAIAGYSKTFARLPAGTVFGQPPEPQPSGSAWLVGLLKPLTSFSALARNISQRWSGTSPGSILAEPLKPSVKLKLPAKPYGGRLSLAAAEKDTYFAELIRDLDQFQQIAREGGARPIVSDERLCVWQGVRFNGDTQRGVYRQLNGSIFWPLSYAQIRRLLDAHNAAINTWAEANEVPVVDVDTNYPRDPTLCSDAFHDLPLGMRLRAWIIFQRLIPLIRNDLAAGIVPHPNAVASGQNPAFAAPIEYLDRETLLRHMQAESADEKQKK
jgi:hypothetical protein